MDVFAWFLVISLHGTDEILVKQMESKNECIKVQKKLVKKSKGKFKDIEAITCEEGSVMDSYKASDEKEEFL
jgi:hypothetical protein